MYDQTDDELMQLAKADPDQFAPLYERYVDRVYAYCLRRLSHPHDAEDVCSQVFVQVLRHRANYRANGTFGAWLFAIARNVVNDFYRHHRLTLPVEDEWADDARPFDHIDTQQDHQLVQTLIAQLPSDHRELVYLSIEADLNSQEIGEIVGKQAGAVRVQLHRIFKHLRHQYGQHTGEKVHE